MRRTLAAVFAAVLLALLTGCVPSTPPASPTPEPSVTPVFASDEEALAAAEKAYREYEAAVDASLSTYETAGLDRVAVGDALTEARAGVEKFRGAGERQTGASQIDSPKYVQGDAQSGTDIQIYACLDVSAVNVLNSSGVSVSVPGRTTRFPTIVSFELNSARDALVVSDEEVWSGANFCA